MSASTSTTSTILKPSSVKSRRDEFDQRLLKAFEELEKTVEYRTNSNYGTATWNGYRNETGAKDYLSLAEVVGLAEKAGGKQHHFKVIQLPLNLGMSEALSAANQTLGGKQLTLLEAAQELRHRRHVQRLGAARPTHPRSP